MEESNQEGGPLEAFVKGTKAWFPDEREGWIIATLDSKKVTNKNVLLEFVSDEKGKEITFESTFEKLEANKYAELPPLKNPPILEGIDDLANLSYLHEPAVLHNVKLRYLQEQIYTYSGIVLIAMNPFAKLAIYTQDIMREYSGKRHGELEPHLFAIAEDAYRAMLTQKKNQSIIVSGESGAGKTQSAKYIMRYFATVDDLDKGTTSFSRQNSSDIPTGPNASGGATGGTMTEVEEAVLSTNPIMEAFGNSKTTRNDNSSRFGKYIEILFSRQRTDDNQVKIIGAKIRTYLLERSRLIFQPATERNYHIFYQMCAAVPAAERKELGLTAWDTYNYLNQGGTGVIPGIDDAAEFTITQKALSTVGIPVSTQWDIFKICAALLHIGNIQITSTRDEAAIDDSDPALLQASKLLGLDTAEFKKWFVKKQMITRSEKIVTNLSQYQATVGRDSVAKFIYSMLFDWLVKIINKNLAKDEANSASFIGVLDIYGFEHFKKNSFEQFCINYANEKLQQEFNQHVFKLEQEEYVQEKINWSFIDFNDNQPCIDMIENKLGILDLLDEESRLPSGSDQSLINKLYQRFAVPNQKFFEKPRFGQKAFTVKHYACDVTYEIDGFIEKNKDTVSDEQMSLLNNSSFGFLVEVVKIEEEKEATPPPTRPGRIGGGGGALKKPTLGSIFKSSLVKLMETIRSTEVHYIRCIKPNQAKVAFQFEPIGVLQQLRACGVLETIRISCAGYPSRWTYQEFVDRYYLLVISHYWKADPKTVSQNIVKKAIKKEDKYQMGLTKIFFRAGQLAYLEKLRSERLQECVIIIQKNIKRYIARRRFVRQRKAAIKIQSTLRGWITRVRFESERRIRAALRIQKTVRGWLCRKKFQKTEHAIITIQCAIRSWQARRQLMVLRKNHAATQIQKLWRGYVTRKWYKVTIKRIVLIQSCIRRKKAIRELKSLKVEARSVGKLKETNYQLESKVVQLSQMLTAKDSDNKMMIEKISYLENQVAIWKEKYGTTDTKIKALTTHSAEEAQALRKEIHAIQEQRDILTKENEKLALMLKKKDDEVDNLEQDIIKLKEEVKRIREEVRTAPRDDSNTIVELRGQVTALQDQLKKMVSGKWKADIHAETVSASTSPTAVVSPGGLPSVAKLMMERLGYGGGLPATDKAGTPLDANSKRAASLASRMTLYPDAAVIVGPGGETLIELLEDPALEAEILDQLITNLRIPLPSTQTVATRKEICFPSHLIGCLMNQMLSLDAGERMEELLSSIVKAIQNLTSRFEDDYISAFWISNVFELLCIVKTNHDRATRQRQKNGLKGMTDTGISGDEMALNKIKSDLDQLLIELFHGWVKELKKRLGNMIVPAVIENQSLPGYICKQSGGIWGKWSKSTTSSDFTIEQLLNFLSKLSKTMRCYYMEDAMTRQILTELLRVIGVSSFNHLLMRKNFCTWKRGVQIQYNVSRLEEWCTSHGIAEATLHLQQLLQAAKLLTLNKTSPQDIETIFDVCFLLNPTQIKKLLSLYYAADFDSPLSPELLKNVSSRAILNEKSDVLLLDLEQSPDFNKPYMKTIDHNEKFIPPWTKLPLIQACISATAGIL